MTSALDSSWAAAPSAADEKVAQESSRRLATLLSAGHPIRLRVETADGDDSIEIPPSATQLVVEILAQMARGNAVSLLASQSELTTQEAAALLQVSRPFLIQLLEAGEIPHRKVGTHRRVTVRDLLAYQQRTRQARLQALSELTEQAQDLGMGY